MKRSPEQYFEQKNDDNPDFGNQETDDAYQANLKKQRDRIAKEDESNAKQDRINKTAREVLERLNSFGENPKKKLRPDKFKNRSET